MKRHVTNLLNADALSPSLSFKGRQPRVKSELPVKSEEAFEMTGCALLSGGAHPRPATCQDSLISCNYAESEFPPCLIRLSTAFLMKGRSRSPLSETMTADAKSAATRVGKTQLEGSSVWISVRPSCVSSDGSESPLPAALSLGQRSSSSSVWRLVVRRENK